MALIIQPESPLTDHARTLIAGSEAALREVYSEDECFTFTVEELDTPHITFLVARDGDIPIGCVALVDYGTYGEVKRLFVSPSARSTGAGRALMASVEDIARSLEHQKVMLETGEKLRAAVKLYKAMGYAIRGPFGDYENHPASLFMEKPL